ncbi:tetratricopeptide repeat protein [Paenibacillus sp. Marseille-P2973]|uniref:tetratricopeptide repeat protein n=1 Tax=unclassified Paenibacillus TaxID=185978 RepID=UPI001B381355|nr:tetratricopeptide repeat protein [Paenibacillus sp. Marseille-P2973]MBQ4901360.1 tetratricopeptide repeat protein [Paenibacillus sp. Marseille-P2973]
MTREELIAQLNKWHENDEYQKIVDEIITIPTPLVDDELAVHLGRALNNLGRYKDALKWFNKIDEEGRNNPLWHFRVGYAHYYLDQNEEAVKAFEIAHQMDPEDEDTLEFLEWSRKEAAQANEEEETEESES